MTDAKTRIRQKIDRVIADKADLTSRGYHVDAAACAIRIAALREALAEIENGTI